MIKCVQARQKSVVSIEPIEILDYLQKELRNWNKFKSSTNIGSCLKTKKQHGRRNINLKSRTRLLPVFDFSFRLYACTLISELQRRIQCYRAILTISCITNEAVLDTIKPEKDPIPEIFLTLLYHHI